MLNGFLGEQGLQFLEFLGIRSREILAHAEVFVDVVEFPRIVGERMARLRLPGGFVDRPCKPAIVVDGAIPSDLKVLRFAAIGGLWCVEAVSHADTFDRPLLDSVDFRGSRDFGGLENRRCYIDDVVELVSNLPLGLDPCRPMVNDSVSCPTKIACNLLGPCKGSVSSYGPTCGKVVEAFRTTPLIDLIEHKLGRFGNSVEISHFVEHPEHPTLGAGSVVSDDIHDQRVVQLTHVGDALD